jgi:di/tricarboxylate transporter
MVDATSQKLDSGFFWKVWAGCVGTTIFVQFAIGGGLRFDAGPHPALGQTFFGWFSIATIVAAIVIRWRFLTRAAERRQKAILMIAGLALSGAVEYYSIFFFGPEARSTKISLSALSLLSSIQFAPFYAKARQAG